MEPFDPLSVENIGVTLAIELLEQPVWQLPPPKFVGAGVYAIYYSGTHPAYAGLVGLDNGVGGSKYPVYIGKATRENAKQGFNPRPTAYAKIWERLTQHAESIQSVQDAKFDTELQLVDFKCRYLVLNEAYISLAESVLIATFRPAWNGMGFGSKVVGGKRMTGRPSLWDSLHPGRGGRPAGTAARKDLALAQIKESVEKLSADRSDPRSLQMMRKIKRFL